MVFRGFHLGRVAGAAVLTAVLLFGLGSAYRWGSVDRPVAEAVSAMPAVETVAVTATRSAVQVEVTLAAVDNLRETYLELQTMAGDQAGGREVELRLRDRRSALLIEDYYALHHHLQEALVRGNFPEAAAAAESIGTGRGADRVGLYVDGERLYVQIHRDHDYLYEVIDRTPPPGSLNGWGGGP